MLLREHAGPLRVFGAGELAQQLGTLVFTGGPGLVIITHVAPHNSGTPVPEALKPLLAFLGTRHKHGIYTYNYVYIEANTYTDKNK